MRGGDARQAPVDPHNGNPKEANAAALAERSRTVRTSDLTSCCSTVPNKQTFLTLSSAIG